MTRPALQDREQVDAAELHAAESELVAAQCNGSRKAESNPWDRFVSNACMEKESGGQARDHRES